MITNELKKHVKLYRNQFEHFMETITNSHTIERLSIELDSIIFRIRYMEKNKVDLDKISYERDKFAYKSVQMRKAFSDFLFKFICQVVTIPDPYKLDDLVDILAENVQLDQTFISFDMLVLSDNTDFLEYIDSSIPDDVFNMFPNEFFRLYTDSYNDGIAKAFPELFENKHQYEIGTGDDSDVFVHSVTIQSSEACNLNCFPAESKVLMADRTVKNICDVQVGDYVLSVDENIVNDPKAFDNDWFYNEERLVPTKVTRLYQHEDEVIGYIWKPAYSGCELETMGPEDCEWITPNHPCLTSDRTYEPFLDTITNADKSLIMYDSDWTIDKLFDYEIYITKHKRKCTVYNLETENHTFVCDSLIVHNCTYCVSGDTFIHTALGYPKKIKNIEIGDRIKAFNENINLRYMDTNKMAMINEIADAEVTNVFHRKAEVMTIRSPYIRGYLYITPEHKVLTSTGWKQVATLKPFVDKLGIRDGNDIIFTSNFALSTEMREAEVYNIETTAGTYIANGLCVHNCYQFNKTPMRMDYDTAIEFIENLVTDKYTFVNRYNSPALILEFIGGEPFLEIDLTRKVYEYFLKRCYELKHPWFMLHRLSICSNGLLYFDPKVQEFFKDYHSQISFNISIDGNKKLHDSCRIQPNGEGSYDIAISALNHFNKNYNKERNSKMTLAPSNISYMSESVINFIENGMNVINLNCVFEEGWTKEHALIEYNELKKITNYLLENNLEHVFISIFRETQEGPMDRSRDGGFCGSLGSMLSVRPNGQFYPCIRYMPSSLGCNRKDYCMGCVKDGMIGREQNSEILKELDNVTRRSESNDICYECPIANACANCQALGITVFNDVNKKTTFTCVMNIAEALANLFYWNAMAIKHSEWNMKARRNVLPDEWSLIVIDKDELELLKSIEALALLNEMENMVGD